MRSRRAAPAPCASWRATRISRTLIWLSNDTHAHTPTQVEQLQLFRLMQKDDLHGAGRMLHFQDPSELGLGLPHPAPTAASTAALRQAVLSVVNDRSVRKVSDACDAARMCEALVALVETTLNVSAYAVRASHRVFHLLTCGVGDEATRPFRHACTESYTHAATVWALSVDQGPFSVAPV